MALIGPSLFPCPKFQKSNVNVHIDLSAIRAELKRRFDRELELLDKANETTKNINDYNLKFRKERKN